MKAAEINIRDPFVLCDGGVYYLYGTRAENFGKKTGGFDVYVSHDLEQFSPPRECFDSERFGLNRDVNWAPEVHKYKGRYYMFATFTMENGLKGTHALCADNPLGPFVPHSRTALTPKDCECLDGTLYISKNNQPYLIYCHEHMQIIDGSVCVIKLSDDLSRGISAPVKLFHGSEPYFIDKKAEGEHYVTDGPYTYRTKTDDLLLIWSTFVNEKYTECVARSDNREIDGRFLHLPLIVENDGGHGMIFKAGERLMLTYHTPNRSGFERPVFKELVDTGSTVELKQP